jgi:hypothetical protein
MNIFVLNNMWLIEHNESITSIENLSNEIFLEIFEYLTGFDIFEAFSHLNFRFQNLLNSSLLLLKIKFYFQSKCLLKHQCIHIINPNKHRIFSLHFMYTHEYMCSMDVSLNTAMTTGMGVSSYFSSPSRIRVLTRTHSHLKMKFSFLLPKIRVTTCSVHLLVYSI